MGGGVLIAAKYQGIMGLSRSPATQSWIKLIIWAGVLGGPAGEGRVLFHKVRRLPAMQYSTEHNLQPSLHTEGHVSFPEPQKKKGKCQACIHLKRSHGAAEMQK